MGDTRSLDYGSCGSKHAGYSPGDTAGHDSFDIIRFNSICHSPSHPTP